MDEWISFLTGELSEEESEALLSQGAQDLHAFLDAHPQAMQHVLSILSRRLGSQVDPATWSTVDTSLVNYFGRDLAYLLNWVFQPGDDSSVQTLAQYASPEVTDFLRTIMGLYGPDLENAIALWNEHPDDWRTIYRDVNYDQIGERHLVKIRFEKYNGEEAVIEGSPDSILNLVSNIILTLRLVGTPHAFGQESVDRFDAEVGEFGQLFALEEEEDLDRAN